MKYAVLFVRVSTEKQNLESQIESLRRAALSDGFKHEQLIVVKKKESAVKLDESEREGLNELKSIIESYDVDCIYIFELSRLSRRPMILYSLREQFLKDGIQLKCMNPQFTLLTEDRTHFDNMSSLIFSIFGTFAEQEAIEKKERFHRGKMQLAKESKYSGGRIPYGYTIDYNKNKQIIVCEEEAEIIRLIFNLYESGVSVVKIARELKERGICYSAFIGNGNKRGKEKEFDAPFIHQILTNEFLTGRLIKSKSASFERKYPPIITEEQFDKCRKIAKENSTWQDKERRIYYAYRLITCNECGCKFSGSGLKAGYRCYNAGLSERQREINGWKNKPKCSNNLNISVNIIDSLSWYVAQQAECEYIISAANSDKSEYETKIYNLNQKLNVINSKLSALDEKKQKIITLYIEGDIDENRKRREFDKFENDRLELLKQKIAVDNDILHFKDLLDGLFKIVDFGLNSVEDTLANAEKILAIRKGLMSIDSDYERFKLCQKHIKNIEIEKTKIMYSFRTKKVGEKETVARFITFYLYNGDNNYYYYIPFDGYNGRFINSNEKKEVLDDANIPIIRRFYDKTKLKQKEKRKAQKIAEYEKIYIPGRKYLHGLDEMADFFGVVRSTIWRWIKAGFFEEAISKFDNKTQIMDVEIALELMRKTDNIWIRKILKSYEEKNKK